MSLRGSLRWIGLALLGLVIAAAVALAAGHLASQQIGIASESVSAGNSLAPPVTSAHRRHKEDTGAKGPEKSAEASEPETTTETGEPELPAEPTETTEPETPATGPSSSSEDDGGGAGGGEGRDD